MNNEMKFEKNGLLIPNGALEELGLVGISLSAWLGQDHILLMPQEMTAEQLLHALDGLSQASVELLGVLQEACRMPCAGDCERDMDDVPQVPENIRPPAHAEWMLPVCTGAAFGGRRHCLCCRVRHCTPTRPKRLGNGASWSCGVLTSAPTVPAPGAIELAIRKGFDGMHLSTDCAKKRYRPVWLQTGGLCAGQHFAGAVL